MSITDTMKALLSSTPGPSPEEPRLAEIGREIADAERQLKRLAAERHRHIVPRMRGDGNAENAVAEIDRQAAELHTRIASLGVARNQIEATVAKIQRETTAALEKDRRRHIAVLRRHLFETTREIDATAAALAEKIKTAMSEVRMLARAADSQALGKWGVMLPSAIRNGITPLFDIDPAAPKRPDNNYLGLVSSWFGARAHWTLAQFADEMLDDLAPVFESEAEAAACRDRIAARGMSALIAPLDGGLFVVVPTEHAFATRPEAEVAMRTVSLFRDGGYVLVPWLEGWLILPRYLAAVLSPAQEAA